MGDFIDRQAMLKHIEKTRQDALMIDDIRESNIIMQAMNLLEEVVRNQPSAQPEIIRCKDCKYWDTTWQNDWTPNCHYCPMLDGIREGDFYCADVERRGEQDE